MFLNTNIESTVFGSHDAVIESALKNPNQFREAVVFESLSKLPVKRLNEFVDSEEAKLMIDKGIISHDTLERLANENNNSTLQTTVCHMAKENGDPLWDEIVRLRIEEHRVMDELLNKYSEQAAPIANNVQTDFIESCIPSEFRYLS